MEYDDKRLFYIFLVVGVDEDGALTVAQEILL